MQIPKVTPFLMFNNEAEEAIELYTSVFEDSEVVSMVKYDEFGSGEAGAVQHAIIRLKDQIIMAIDNSNGTEIPMNPSISLFVTVDNVMEMERLYSGLKSGGAILMAKTELGPYREFAWIQDRFGVNFQLALMD